MPHEPGHTNGNAQYRVYGTNEPYNGLTVKIGGYHYTTDEGTLQGDLQELLYQELCIIGKMVHQFLLVLIYTNIKMEQ